MTETTAEELRDEYLARLDEAMRGLPHGVASDIRGGIVEELEGLDAHETAARIAHLGDPIDIAREAQDEVPPAPAYVVATPVAAPAAPRPPATGTRGFAITAALTLSFGGIVLPVLGWFVGAALVCFSPLWKTWEKVTAIVVPFVLFTVSAVLVMTMTGFASSSSGSSSGTGAGPEAMNPLVPAWYDLIWFGVMVLGALLIPASGLWLLWRLRGRAAR
ncbi:HAAS signaling domain-containing protein [Microbacterium sp. PMB16]|uniref:HAAS signaling domain-containing protein n=1 Tax=Microbacterium sp. PMB16 TaxID=3120157 RepID=UPI003F4BA940